MPKKKFAFKSKKPTTTSENASSPNINNSNHNTNNNTKPITNINPPITTPTTNSILNTINTTDEHSLSNLQDQTINLLKDYNNNGNSINALRIFNLKNCKVYGGPINGSIFLENCHNCVFILASRQVSCYYYYQHHITTSTSIPLPPLLCFALFLMELIFQTIDENPHIYRL